MSMTRVWQKQDRKRFEKHNFMHENVNF